MTDEIAPAWTVTGQQERTDQVEGGLFVNGVTVSFRTRAGAIGSVFVPANKYTEDEVRRLITERAAVMNAVSDLRG